MLNPVLRKEIKTSLRSWKLYAAITVYVGIVAVAVGLFIYANMQNSFYSGFDPQDMMILYVVLSLMQLGLILITMPTLTAGSISGERERQTLDLLLITKMSAFSIIIGKLLSSMGIVLLMTVATLPVFAIVFYFGGISIFALLSMTVYLFVISCMVSAISVFLSVIFKKTILSIAFMYLIIGFLCFGTMILFAIFNAVWWNYSDQEIPVFTSLLFFAANPGVGFVSVIDTQLGTNVAVEFMNFYGSNYTDFENFCLTHFWLINGIVNGMITVIFVFLSAHFINPLRKRAKVKEAKNKT